MNQHYISKAKASFKTKLNLFLYEQTLSPDKWSLTLESFNVFQINPAMVREYTTHYWQREYSEVIRLKTIREIYRSIEASLKFNAVLFKEWEGHYVNVTFPTIFPPAEFAKLTQATRCHYCDIHVDEIVQLRNLGNLNKKKDRGLNLEVDRKDSNFEYTPDNAVMS